MATPAEIFNQFLSEYETKYGFSFESSLPRSRTQLPRQGMSSGGYVSREELYALVAKEILNSITIAVARHKSTPLSIVQSLMTYIGHHTTIAPAPVQQGAAPKKGVPTLNIELGEGTGAANEAVLISETLTPELKSGNISIAATQTDEGSVQSEGLTPQPSTTGKVGSDSPGMSPGFDPGKTDPNDPNSAAAIASSGVAGQVTTPSNVNYAAIQAILAKYQDPNITPEELNKWNAWYNWYKQRFSGLYDASTEYPIEGHPEGKVLGVEMAIFAAMIAADSQSEQTEMSPTEYDKTVIERPKENTIRVTIQAESVDSRGNKTTIPQTVDIVVADVEIFSKLMESGLVGSIGTIDGTNRVIELYPGSWIELRDALQSPAMLGIDASAEMSQKLAKVYTQLMGEVNQYNPLSPRDNQLPALSAELLKTGLTWSYDHVNQRHELIDLLPWIGPSPTQIRWIPLDPNQLDGPGTWEIDQAALDDEMGIGKSLDEGVPTSVRPWLQAVLNAGGDMSIIDQAFPEELQASDPNAAKTAGIIKHWVGYILGQARLASDPRYAKQPVSIPMGAGVPPLQVGSFDLSYPGFTASTSSSYDYGMGARAGLATGAADILKTGMNWRDSWNKAESLGQMGAAGREGSWPPLYRPASGDTAGQATIGGVPVTSGVQDGQAATGGPITASPSTGQGSGPAGSSPAAPGSGANAGTGPPAGSAGPATGAGPAADENPVVSQRDNGDGTITVFFADGTNVKIGTPTLDPMANAHAQNPNLQSEIDYLNSLLSGNTNNQNIQANQDSQASTSTQGFDPYELGAGFIGGNEGNAPVSGRFISPEEAAANSSISGGNRPTAQIRPDESGQGFIGGNESGTPTAKPIMPEGSEWNSGAAQAAQAKEAMKNAQAAAANDQFVEQQFNAYLIGQGMNPEGVTGVNAVKAYNDFVQQGPQATNYGFPAAQQPPQSQIYGIPNQGNQGLTGPVGETGRNTSGLPTPNYNPADPTGLGQLGNVNQVMSTPSAGDISAQNIKLQQSPEEAWTDYWMGAGQVGGQEDLTYAGGFPVNVPKPPTYNTSDVVPQTPPNWGEGFGFTPVNNYPVTPSTPNIPSKVAASASLYGYGSEVGDGVGYTGGIINTSSKPKPKPKPVPQYPPGHPLYRQN